MLVDLRVDDHEQPVDGAARGSTALHDLLFGKTPREEWIEVDDDARAELVRAPARASATTASSSRRSRAWAGTENLEERVDGVERIDPVVLRELRAR